MIVVLDVLDTNVIISAIFFSKRLRLILELWSDSRFKLALSKEIAEEYITVFERICTKFEPIPQAEEIFRSYWPRLTIFNQ